MPGSVATTIRWGVPVHDDRRHVEFLTLEGAQAGLSWSTILAKRPGYRRAFAGFDPRRAARFTAARLRALAADPAIVRNRRKIASVVQNALAFLAVQREFRSFDSHVRGFLGSRPRWRPRRDPGTVPARTPESDRWSRDLKRRGFSFVGSTIIYADMQAVGLVNDHLRGCYRRGQIEARATGRGPAGPVGGPRRSRACPQGPGPGGRRSPADP